MWPPGISRPEKRLVSEHGPFSLVSLHLVQFGKSVCTVSTPGKKLVVDTVRGREDKTSNKRGGKLEEMYPQTPNQRDTVHT